jgi:hypothetical protein
MSELLSPKADTTAGAAVVLGATVEVGVDGSSLLHDARPITSAAVITAREKYLRFTDSPVQ